jgi:methanogenic corrinoid protein MtbC1
MNARYVRASETIDAQREAISNAVVSRQYELQAANWETYGDSGHAKSLRDVEYHLSYLSQALAVSDPSLFSEYLAWVKVLFAGLEFPPDALLVTLGCMRDELEARLPAELSAAASEYIELGLAHLLQGHETQRTFLEKQEPLGLLAREYLDALMRGERHVASRLILDSVEQGTSIRDVYLHVFQPSQYEIGRLWQMNRITVAQEHYCTAATQLIMSQLYPRIFRSERIGRRLVATCVGDELHELGVRMVADFFEMEGWDTYYLGANTPTDSILQAIGERRADILAVSATMAFHVGAVADLIARVRTEKAAQGVPILVGGYPFNQAPGLWETVGADGCAPDAQEAIVLASRMIGAA